MTPSFASCIEPLTVEQFVAEYRGRRIGYFRGTCPAATGLCDSDSLSGVLSRMIVSAALLRVLPSEHRGAVREVLTPPLTPTRDRRTVKPAPLEAELQNGATVAIEHAEAYFAPIHDFCTMLSAAMSARVNATLFAVYRPGEPSGLHWDDRDMLVLQVEGRKRWPIYAPTVAYPLFDSDRAGGRVRPSELIGDYTLEPGDVLYIPRGWPHNPESVGGRSVHVAFSIATPTAADLLDWVRTDLMEGCEQVRMDLPIDATADDRRRFAQQLRDAVLARLTDAQLNIYYQRHRLNAFSRKVRLPDDQQSGHSPIASTPAVAALEGARG